MINLGHNNPIEAFLAMYIYRSIEQWRPAQFVPIRCTTGRPNFARLHVRTKIQTIDTRVTAASKDEAVREN
jgi:hypothetical protein